MLYPQYEQIQVGNVDVTIVTHEISSQYVSHESVTIPKHYGAHVEGKPWVSEIGNNREEAVEKLKKYIRKRGMD